MGLFRKKPHTTIPDETTADRARLKAQAIGSLNRAKALKARSSAVAADLSEHSQTNHYIERIRKAYGIPA